MQSYLLSSPHLPVVYNKDDNLGQCQQEVSKVRNGLIHVIYSREVYHIQSLNNLIKAVHERHSGAFGLLGAIGNLCRLMYTISINSYKCHNLYIQSTNILLYLYAKECVDQFGFSRIHQASHSHGSVFS